MPRVDDRRVRATGKLRLDCAFTFQVVEIFEEEQPTGLLNVVELGCAARLLPKNVVDIPECLFEHATPWLSPRAGIFGLSDYQHAETRCRKYFPGVEALKRRPQTEDL
jgi:hypothetical protein